MAMSKGCSRWLKGCGAGCGVGCGLLVLILLLCFVIPTLQLLLPMRKAKETRDTLRSRLGEIEDFTPAPDGSISPERMEAFLEVRQSLTASCDEIRTAFEQIERMDEPEDRDASGPEIAREIFKTFGSDLLTARNQALLDAEMGLGEYTYIFVLAYYVDLGFSPSEGLGEIEHLQFEAREALLEILRNQLKAAEAEFQGAEKAPQVLALEEEIARMERDSGYLPWQDGLPPPIVASIEPYRQQLDDLYCAVTASIELDDGDFRGFHIDHDD